MSKLVMSVLLLWGGCRGRAVAPDPSGACPFEWRSYPYDPAGTEIRFPRDEGAHYVTDYSVSMEWWYTIFHLQSLDGRRFSIMTTFFMPQAGAAFRPFNFIDVEAGERSDGGEWGSLDASEEFLDLVYHSDIPGEPESFLRTERDPSGDLMPFHYHEVVSWRDPEGSGETQSLDLHMEALRPPLLVGGDGYVTIGQSGESYYYSLTDMKVTGSIEKNGRTWQVEGMGWMDHQWGPFMLNPTPMTKNSYEWMAIQLDNGQQYMVSSIFDRQGRSYREEGFGSVGWMGSDCIQGRTLDQVIERLAYWHYAPKDFFFASKWRIQVPETDMDVLVTPVVEDQTVDFLGSPFYEGRALVQGTVGGSAVTGIAFVEMTHHYEAPAVEVVSPSEGDFVGSSVSVSWTVSNRDDGMPLRFVVTLGPGESGGNWEPMTLCDDVDGTSCMADLSTVPVGDPDVVLTVTARSVDGTVTGSDSVTLHLVWD